ncbi:MAG TPA: hypothetical protein VD905_02930 [Flavobacteriales bacterium]|nr:hypothetical protein [Flavobacteriales bacterium]
MNQQDKRPIVSQTIYDFVGRPAIQVLPSPIKWDVNAGLDYYTDLTMTDHTSGSVVVDYDYHYFDTDSKTAAPDDIRASGSKGAGHYYSTQNTTDPGMNAAYIPDAEGYPYVRTQYKNDGTNRVKSQSGVGDELKPNSTHEVKIHYGSPGSQQELDRLFGNEVGDVYMYSKEAVVDANGQISIKYMDNEGRVVATALSGATPANLNSIYSKPSGFPTITAALHTYNQLSNDNAWVVNHSFINTIALADYSFSYTMNGDTVCNDCIDYDEGGGVDHCEDCKYDLYIKVTNAETGFVEYSNSWTNINDKSTVAFTADDLDIGTYTVYKKIEMHKTFVTSNLSNFVLNQSCVDLAEASGADCAPACSTQCEQEHSFIDPETGNTIWFEQNDDATNSITIVAIETAPGVFDGGYGDQDDVDDLIEPCITACTTAVSPSAVYPCEFKLNALKIDMSPGGQYFDNLPDLFDGGSYNKDGWLNGKTIPSEITSACASCTTWTNVRNNWDDDWAIYMVEDLHPEYCAWEKECIGCVNVGYDAVKAWYDQFVAADPAFSTSEKFYNPTGITQNTTKAVTGSPGYQPVTTTTTSDSQYDDILQCLDTSLTGPLRRMLLKFLPNSNTSPTSYYSIWYVLEDPDGIAQANGNNHSASVDDNVEAYFDQLHGGTGITPILGTGDGQVSEAEFFRNAYMLFRQKTLYDYANTCSGLYLTDAGDGKTSSGFIIHYHENPLFENWPWPFTSSTVSDLTTDVIDASITDACEDHASEWMEVVTAVCTTLTAPQLTAMEGYLVDICEGSDPETFSYTYNVLETGTITVNSVACSTFVQVIESYSGCNPNDDLYPVVPEPYARVDCACENIKDFLDANGFTYASDRTAVLDALIAADLLTTAEVSAVSSGDVDTWMDECPLASPVYTNLVDLIGAFQCPTDLTNTQDADQWETDCDAAMDELAEFNAENTFNSSVNTLSQAYEKQIYTSCLDTGTTKLNERFYMTYTLEEFHYTLYFYDQAGNLVKTVSPEGVARYVSGSASFTSILGTSDFDDIALHRANSSNPFIHPNHVLKVNYKYNSLNQLTERTTPDEGKTTYFYDYLGRLVASQNALQATQDKYSIVLYDALSRETTAFVGYKTGGLTQTTTGDPTAWATWYGSITGSNRTEITEITYDIPYNTSIATVISPTVQNNLRNRISCVAFTQTGGSPVGTYYDYATHYSYDIHGNVATLVHDYGYLQRFGHGIKRVQYEYELVSGNVTQLKYQDGKYDQYYQKYFYDANNQLEEVYTSADNILWERDADYFYQPTGQLARKEQGQRAVNGLDFAYTIQGWLKGVNSGTIKSNRDIGKDGHFTASTEANKYYGLDVAGYSIGYFQGDYSPVTTIGTTDKFETVTAGNTLFTDTKSNFYNGNIGHVITSQTTTNNTSATRRTIAKAYEYDQLYRLRDAETNQAVDFTNNDWDTYSATLAFRETGMNYDGNGNILNFQRATSTATELDNLTYNYTYSSSALTNNRLNYLDDAASGGDCTSTLDIDDQSSGNYAYNANGQLIKDAKEFITDIFWYHRGKVKKVIKDKAVNTVCSTEVAKNDVEYLYDGMGHKVCKIDKPHKAAGAGIDDNSKYIYTWYVNDAMGNVLSTYTQTFALVSGNNYNSTMTQGDIMLYGLGREGMLQPEGRSKVQLMSFSATPFLSTQTETLASSSAYNEDLWKWSVLTSISNNSTPAFALVRNKTTREAGNKLFEINNYLGSVVTVTLDRKLQYDDGTPDGIVDRYIPEISAWYDYYSHGSVAEQGILISDIRYGFQGMEKGTLINAGAYEADFRLVDTRIGRWFSCDPVTHPWESSYAAFANNPVYYVDPSGLDPDGGVGDGAKDATGESSSFPGKRSPPKPKDEKKPKQGGLLSGAKVASNGYNQVKQAVKIIQECDGAERFLGGVYEEAKNTVEFAASLYNKDPKAYMQAGQMLETAGSFIAVGAGTAGPSDYIKVGETGYNFINQDWSDPKTWGKVAFWVAVSKGAGAIGAAGETSIFAPLAEDAAILSEELIVLEEAESFISVYHKGNLAGGEVSTTRTLSTGLDKDAVSGLERQGQLWEFKIPKSKMLEWKIQGLVESFRDLDFKTGIINEEMRFSPKLAPELNKYLVK